MDKKNILDRLSVSLGCSNDTELSKAIDVARATLGTWRSRGTIPIDKVCKIAEKHNLSLDYLYFGKTQSATPHKPDGWHPGFYGYLLGKILDKLSKNERLESYPLSDLGEIALFIYNQIDVEAVYSEQLKRVDEIILWFVRCVFSTASIESDKNNSSEIKRIFELVEQQWEEEYKRYCLECNFDEQSTYSIIDLKNIKRSEIETMCEVHILTGDVRFNPAKPSQNFFESIIDLGEFISSKESMIRMSKEFLRDEIDALIEQGIDIKPEHLSDPMATGLLQKRIAAQEADKD